MENETKTHGDNVFVLIEEYYPKDSQGAEVLKIAKESVHLIEGTEGLIMAKTLNPKKNDAPICNITTWVSEDQFKSFMKSDAVKELYKSDEMAKVKAATSDIKVNMYQLEYGWHQ